VPILIVAGASGGGGSVASGTGVAVASGAGGGSVASGAAVGAGAQAGKKASTLNTSMMGMLTVILSSLLFAILRSPFSFLVEAALHLAVESLSVCLADHHPLSSMIDCALIHIRAC
jgi:hypothetical protein